jgi:hypothetical protein
MTMDTLRVLEAELRHVREEKDYMRPFTHDGSPEIEEALRRWDQRETRLLNTIASEEAILQDMFEEYEREEN